MISNYNSGRTSVSWFTELKDKYPGLWYYENKNSKSNGKDRNVLIFGKEENTDKSQQIGKNRHKV